MRYLAQVTCIFNLGFVLATLMRFFPVYEKAVSPDSLKPDILIGTILMFYYLSVFVNALFILLLLVRRWMGKSNKELGWMMRFNILVFITQLYFFFLG